MRRAGHSRSSDRFTPMLDAKEKQDGGRLFARRHAPSSEARMPSAKAARHDTVQLSADAGRPFSDGLKTEG